MKLSMPIFRLKQQARTLARTTSIPHLQALDGIAAREGFRSWSHLAATAARGDASERVLDTLRPGDLMLLGARPGHGKTLLGAGIAVAAARRRRPAFVFTLEDTEATMRRRFETVGADGRLREAVTLDASDEICAAYVVDRMAAVPSGAVAMVDYLQLLDQRRCHAELDDQLRSLRAFAKTTGTTFVLLSQIDRTFETSGRPLPTLADVRRPNPVDLSVFTTTCFVHDGRMELAAVA